MQQRLRVLVVDDNQDMVDSMTALLRIHGHEAKGIYSAQSIATDFTEFNPDVIVLDVAMPGMDGWSAARQIRRTANGRCPRIIVFSGEYPKGADEWLIQSSGADHFLIKSVDRKRLLELVALGRPPETAS